MWNRSNGLVWQPWPNQLDWPPDVVAACGLRELPHLAVLLGSAGAGPRTRFGLVGVPQAAQLMTPSPTAVAEAIDQRPGGGVRLVALGYDLGAALLHLPAQVPPRRQPAGLVFDFGALLLVDHLTRRYALSGPDLHAVALLRDTLHPSSSVTTVLATAGCVSLQPLLSDAHHARRIKMVQEHISAGDIYQANLTRRLAVLGDLEPLAALIALNQHNPVAHTAYLRHPQVELLSNSMETLLAFNSTTACAQSLPIKGTRARGLNPRQDQLAAEQLLRNAKERAEHIMIVDLVRNDLGRVCRPGSVTVPALMRAEAYHGVWHGVSLVQGALAPERTAGQLLAALFPGGSITGAPKRRAMQIISELEQEPRGFYTGCLGIISPSGCLNFSILIRTLVRDAEGWSLSVGGGIVADSQAPREIAETWEKVAVFQQILARKP